MIQHYQGDDQWPEIGAPLALQQPLSASFADPAAYQPDAGLVAAVNSALMLGQPLLLTGEPGTGKTQLAYHVARRLGLLQPIKYEVKSTTESRDLFYTVDSLRQFRDYSIQNASEQNTPLDYIEFQALGLAITRAANLAENTPLHDKRAHRRELDLWASDHTTLDFPHRSVVLIDEIDKAPRDVPNDLLNELEHLYFHIPELKQTLGDDDRITARDDLRPIVIFTSNSEKNLPDAFLRRCIYYNIEFPDRDKLTEIIAGRMASFQLGEPLVDDVLNLVFNHLRKGARALDKKPGTAEVLAFLMALKRQGVADNAHLEECYELAVNAAGTLAKNSDDMKKVMKHLNDYYPRKSS